MIILLMEIIRLPSALNCVLSTVGEEKDTNSYIPPNYLLNAGTEVIPMILSPL